MSTFDGDPPNSPTFDSDKSSRSFDAENPEPNDLQKWTNPVAEGSGEQSPTSSENGASPKVRLSMRGSSVSRQSADGQSHDELLESQNQQFLMIFGSLVAIGIVLAVLTLVEEYEDWQLV
jgi:hypothetical protein